MLCSSVKVHAYKYLFFLCSQGNKCDLESLQEVSLSEAKSLALSQNFIGAIETSAKENTNVDDAFLKMARVSLGKLFCAWQNHAM